MAALPSEAFNFERRVAARSYRRRQPALHGGPWLRARCSVAARRETSGVRGAVF